MINSQNITLRQLRYLIALSETSQSLHATVRICIDPRREHAKHRRDLLHNTNQASTYRANRCHAQAFRAIAT